MAAAAGTFFFKFGIKNKKNSGLGGNYSLINKKNIPKKQVNLYFYQGFVKMSVFQPVNITSSLYFGASGPVLNLSSSNSLGILMSTHGPLAAILGKNAFQFGVLGPNHLAHYPLACACVLQWIIILYKMRMHSFACAAILKAN